jgi:PIN domain nuclease of toxin-antitoxin system
MVLDASALLALINAEPGAQRVEAVLPDAVMSAVNLSEVVAKLGDIGITEREAWEEAADLVPRIVAFDTDLARRAARLRPKTRALGLSLGDRACLALAELLTTPVLTADRTWRKLDLDIDIRFIR